MGEAIGREAKKKIYIYIKKKIKKIHNIKQLRKKHKKKTFTRISNSSLRTLVNKTIIIYIWTLVNNLKENPDLMKKIMMSMRKRAQVCVNRNGSHSQVERRGQLRQLFLIKDNIIISHFIISNTGSN